MTISPRGDGQSGLLQMRFFQTTNVLSLLHVYKRLGGRSPIFSVFFLQGLPLQFMFLLIAL